MKYDVFVIVLSHSLCSSLVVCFTLTIKTTGATRSAYCYETESGKEWD